MKPLMKWALILAVPLLLVLSLSAGAATAPAAKAKPIKPRTLVTEKGLIHGFAQDGNAIAWIGRGIGRLRPSPRRPENLGGRESR